MNIKEKYYTELIPKFTHFINTKNGYFKFYRYEKQ